MGSRCPLTWGLFFGTAALATVGLKRQRHKQTQLASSSLTSASVLVSPSTTLTECEVAISSVSGAASSGTGNQCHHPRQRQLLLECSTS
mmetsp:Transcript_19887/g.21324  ORF Transcript_19887/g.21324 Transcript_19887/m.21324 type:complete len:89 (+) Transcript_19887:391-657(+)